MFFRKKYPIDLSEDEEIVAVVYKHWLRGFSPTILVLLLAVAILAAATFLFFEQLGLTGKFLLAGAFAVLFILIGTERYKNNRDCLLITNQRLTNIDVRSLFNQKITEVHYDKVQSVFTSRDGFFKMIFNMGDITVKTGAEDGDIVINFLPAPAKVQSLILDLQQSYIRSPTLLDKSSQESLRFNQKSLSELLGYLKTESKKGINEKPAELSKGKVWKEVIKDYLTNKPDKLLSKTQRIFSKQNHERYADPQWSPELLNPGTDGQKSDGRNQEDF